MNTAKARFFASPLARLPRLSGIQGRNPEKAGLEANDFITELLLGELCPQGGTFIDIGAQYGAVFAKALRHDPTLNVIAFEADAAKAEVLRKVHTGVLIFSVAAGEHDGKADFHLNLKSSGFNSLVPVEGDSIRRTQVRVVRLDDVIDDATPDLIKIDVEGAELGVLRGARDLIKRNRPTIVFECILRGTNALGYSARDLWSWLDSQGYSVFAPNRVAHNAPPMTLEAFLDAQQYPFTSHNYFAVPVEQRFVIRDRARDILGVRAA